MTGQHNDTRCSGTFRAPRMLPAPSPFVGEGWGGGWFRILTQSLQPPPSLSLPHKGGGNAVARHVDTQTQQVRGTSA
jgi:hypothetical protein